MGGTSAKLPVKYTCVGKALIQNGVWIFGMRFTEDFGKIVVEVAVDEDSSSSSSSSSDSIEPPAGSVLCPGKDKANYCDCESDCFHPKRGYCTCAPAKACCANAT